MSIKEIYEKVNLTLPIEQRRFFNFFEDSVNELSAMYNNLVFQKDTEYKPPETLEDENTVLPLYHNAIVDNIVFLSGGEESLKSEFLRKSHNAYLKYWNDNAKGRRIKGMRW